MVVRGSACRAAIWTSRRSTPASSMVVTKVWRSMCGCAVAIHPGAAAVEQDRPSCPGADRPVDGSPDRGRQRDQDHLGALAAHAQDPVAVFFTEVGDIGTGGFEYPQAEQPKHGHQRESTRVR